MVALIPENTKYTYLKTLEQLRYTDHYLGCNMEKRSNTGIEEKTSAEFEIYPNPAKSFIKIISPDAGIRIEVYDILGNLLFAKDNLSKENKISLPNIVMGTYILKFIDNGQLVAAKKLVIVDE